MSSIAYKDTAKTQTITSREIKTEYKGNQYYCYNKSCNAIMGIVSMNGESKHYFRAYPSSPHIMGCPYGCSGSSIELSDYNESKFNFDLILSKLLEESAKNTAKPSNNHNIGEINIPSKKTIRTIKQLYFLLKNLDEKSEYNQYKVGYMLLDTRSIYMNKKGVWGYKLVEAKIALGKFYDNNLEEIYLKLPEYDEYSFILKINNGLYSDIRNLIYKNKDFHILVAGMWKKVQFNRFSINIVSKKQITIIKD